ncbi:MAG: LegC family aminotransferase [Lautropia sp.]
MIPLSVPNLAGNEWAYVKECLDTGWISSAGAFVDRFEQQLAEFTGAGRAVACVNGTAALHIALMLAGVKRDDAVLVPTLTFVASVNAISHLGAVPILIDANPDDWQWDLDLVEECLTDHCTRDSSGALRTREGRRVTALMPVHVLGNMCDMDRLLKLAERFQLPVVEDSTEALGSYYKKRHAGTFGVFGAFSFNGNKIISTGGGGMIVSNDVALASRAKHITTTAKAKVDEYFHDEIGYNYRLVNVLAAIGAAQMEQLPYFLRRKVEIARSYRLALDGVAGVKFQKVGPLVSANEWLTTIRTSKQQALRKYLTSMDIQTRPFWVPMNELPMYSTALFVSRNNYARQIYSECLSLPSSTNLKNESVQAVITGVRNFLSA